MTAAMRRAVFAVCFAALVAAETVALGLTVIALFTPQPFVPGVDTGKYEIVGFTSLLAGLLTTFSLAVTAILVNVGWVRARWLGIPAVMLVVIVARYHAMPGWGWA